MHATNHSRRQKARPPTTGLLSAEPRKGCSQVPSEKGKLLGKIADELNPIRRGSLAFSSWLFDVV